MQKSRFDKPIDLALSGFDMPVFLTQSDWCQFTHMRYLSYPSSQATILRVPISMAYYSHTGLTSTDLYCYLKKWGKIISPCFSLSTTFLHCSIWFVLSN